MTSTDRLVSIHADESFPTRVQAAINALIAAGIIGKADAATVNTALAAKAPLASPAFTGTPTGITKTHVGLSNVDNTSDANKPVSTAQAAAISAAVSGLVNGAPGALDTLNELSAALGNDASFATTVTTALASKVNSSTYTAGLAGKQALQQVAASVTTDGAAVVNKHNPVDATSGVRAITLPGGQTEGTQVSIEKTDASANVVNITGNIRGVAATTIPLAFLSESLMLRADSAGSWWPIAGHRTKASLDAAYGPTATQTLTNKRVTRRVDTTTSAATYTFSWDNFDAAKITAQAAALTLANPTGTPSAMQPVIFRIKDNGTAQTIGYGTQFRAIGVTLPTTTVVGKTLYLGGMWNSEDSKLDVVAVGQEA